MLKRLSLIKQLFLILTIIALVFTFVLMPLIDYNLNSIVDKKMYDDLYMSQSSIIDYDYFIPDNKNAKKVTHLIYNMNTNTINAPTMVYNEYYLLYNNVFGSDLERLVVSSAQSIENKISFNGKDYYYLITNVNNNDYIISLTTSDYSQDLLLSLRNQVVYIQYAFLLIIAFVLIVWVLTIINPLNKIKNYIDAIKGNRRYDLVIDREDELGIVSKALIDMKQELDKQDKIKTEMIHNISHDLKTPISVIKTYSQSVKDDIYPYGDKDSSMDIIIENAERLEHKVKLFLYLNRLDYLQGEKKELKEINIKQTIETVVQQLSLVHTHISIETELEDVLFIGEEEHWRVAIENIVENASRYANSVIRIILRDQYLEIYNDGEHIDEVKMEYLFKPYVRGVKGQFGLGLSIVEKIATMYGYSVEANNLEKGVSFVFRK